MQCGWSWLTLLLVVTTFAAERCTVHTFFEELTGGIMFQSNKKVHMDRKDHLQIVQIWLRNWYAGGWNPRLLRLRHATSYPNFEHYRRKFASLPTVNWRAYEMTCYLRWLAFAEAGGGAFVDYDIMNYPASQIPKSAGPCGAGELLVSYPKAWPMLLFGGRPAVERLISALAEYEVDPARDVFDGRPHISDMIIVRNMAEHLLDMALPNPRSLWHFASIQKANLTATLEADEPEAHELVSKMSRSEWIRHTLTLSFMQRNRLYIWTSDGRSLDQSVASLLKPLSVCPEKGSPSTRIILNDFRLAPGEYPLCDFRLIDRMPEWEADNEWIILFVEPIEEKSVRDFMKCSGARKFSSESFKLFYSREEHHNTLVKTFSKSISLPVPTDDITLLLEQVKAGISKRKNVVIGLMDRLIESKMILEYSIGFTLPNLQEPYVPPSRVHSAQLESSTIDEIHKHNWADVELLSFLRAIWTDRLKNIISVESQLEQYHDAPQSLSLLE